MKNYNSLDRVLVLENGFEFDIPEDFGLIAIGLYVGLMLLTIPLFNYLQYGKFWYVVNDEDRKQ